MPQSLLGQSGAQPQKQTHYVPLFVDKCFTGIYTQRSVFHDPSDMVTSRFYGGRPDVLWDGLNTELTNDLTLARRPGCSDFSTFQYPTPPDRAYAFHRLSGSIQVLIDLTAAEDFLLTSVGNAVAGSAVYSGTITGGASNAFAGWTFIVKGFDNPNNNGTFSCTASTSGTLTLSNPNAVQDTSNATAATGGSIYWDEQNGSAELILAKSPGAGQAYFVSVGDTCYIGDGVDQVKYTPWNINGIIWNWGIASPTSAPSVTIVASGASAVAWAASTWFSTMGLIVDPNGNAQQLYSVNASPATNPNATQIGESGNGTPAFNLGTGNTTIDGSVTWTTQGQITLRQRSTTYLSGRPIFDPKSNMIWINSHNFSWVSCATADPTFQANISASGSTFNANRSSEPCGGGKWMPLGVVGVQPTVVDLWMKNTAFNQYIQPISGNDPNKINSAICFPIAPYIASNGTLCNGTPIYLLGATTAGTTSNTNYTPWAGITSQTPGEITIDNQLAWICLGSATWAANTPYTAWVYGNGTFSTIKDTNGNMQVCIVSGSSGSSQPTWETAYGSVTNDNTVQWVCVGPPMMWEASNFYYLPVQGFAPPQPSQPYGGASVIGSGYVQFVISSGKSGLTAPSWSTTVGQTTTDNTITWITTAKQSSVQGITWTKGHVYAYSFKCRTPTDPYVTTGLLTFDGLNSASALTPLGNVPGLTSPLGPYLGGGTGAISTASPIFTISGAETNSSVNTVTGLGSTDLQVDTIVIWRDADGGGAANMFELVEIPAPKPVGGVAQPWSFNDFLPDVPSTIGGINYPGLDALSPAPIDDSNDPPPVGFLPMAYHFTRIWGPGSTSTVMNWSGGPDVVTGNPNEAFNPSDYIEFLSPIINAVHTPAGLVTFLTSDIECIYGGPSTASFYNTTLFPGTGLGNFNGLDVHGGEIYFFSSDSQLMVITPSLQLSRIGFPIGDKLVNFNSALVYVAIQDYGLDNAVFVADGSTGWYRLNPHQVPQGEAIWSPRAAITGGTKMVQSVEISTGVHKLLIGPTGNNSSILERNLNVFSDNGSAYDAYFIMGALTLAQPGQLAVLKFTECDFSGVGSQPTVSYLLDSPNTGSYIPYVTSVNDPPSIYGFTITPNGYFPNRYYFSQTATVARCRRILIKVDYGSTDTVENELLSLAIFGRIYQES